MDFKTVTSVVYPAVLLGLVAKFGLVGYEKWSEYNVVRTASICPSLFSISRSARDTLIVMKAEPLCNSYILANLK